MSAISDAAARLKAALELVPESFTYTDPGSVLNDLPALVIGPPSLLYTNGLPSPTEARFTVHVVVQSDEFAMTRMWDLIGEVSAVIDEHTAAVVTGADPSTTPAFNALPAYDIQVDFPLEQR